MTQQDQDKRIDYIEFSCKDLQRAKEFYISVFGWTFTDYGATYTSFDDGRLAGGFNVESEVKKGGPLIVIYGKDLTGMQSRIEEAGGSMTREIFDFPGGRRFHFEDTEGNELALWSDQ